MSFIITLELQNLLEMGDKMNGLIILGAIVITAFGIVVPTSDSRCPCHHGGLLCSLCEDELREV